MNEHLLRVDGYRANYIIKKPCANDIYLRADEAAFDYAFVLNRPI